MIFGAFVGFVLLLLLWAAVIAPGRTRRLFAKLERQGWGRVAVEDEALRSVLEALRPFDLTAYMSDDAKHSDAKVVSALAQSDPNGTRYLVQLRVNSRDASDESVMSFNTLVLEPRRLSFPESCVYVVAKELEPRVGRSFEILGLRRVVRGLDPDFDVLFLALEGPGTDVLLPSPLQKALLASVELFVSSAGKRSRHSPRVCLRLSSSGWALLVPEPIFMDQQMRGFLETADRVSEALS